jgi:sec-independent protein translocase protein TatB
MFDLTSSKLLILGLVALIVVGPKELPLLLRTIGKYVGLIRRHANDFRAQFDEAMRDQELANLKAEMEAVKRDVEHTVHSTREAVKTDVAAASQHIEHHIHSPHASPVPPHQPSDARGEASQSPLPHHQVADANSHQVADATVHQVADATVHQDRVLTDHRPPDRLHSDDAAPAAKAGA